MKKNLLLCCGAISFLALTSGLSAQVPSLINYQGFLNDPLTGVPIDTVQTMTFAIYDVGTPGTAIWTETQNDVLIRNGYFSVMLGAVIAISSDIFDGDDKFLGVRIGSDPEMTPRKQIVSVGYAMHADNASRVDHQRLNNNDGSVNESADPVSWYKIKDMPPGFADGSDDGGSAGSISQINVGAGMNITNPTGPATTLDLNMGHGNAINADMVDGKHAAEFAETAHGHWGATWLGGSSTTHGLRIQGSVPWNNGVLIAENNNNGPGLWGVNHGTGNAVRGNNSGSGIGVFGQSVSGIGVEGASTDSYGVKASSANNYGMYAETGNNSGYFAGYFKGQKGITTETPTGNYSAVLDNAVPRIKYRSAVRGRIFVKRAAPDNGCSFSEGAVHGIT